MRHQLFQQRENGEDDPIRAPPAQRKGRGFPSFCNFWLITLNGGIEAMNCLNNNWLDIPSLYTPHSVEGHVWHLEIFNSLTKHNDQQLTKVNYRTTETCDSQKVQCFWAHFLLLLDILGPDISFQETDKNEALKNKFVWK